MIKVKKKYRKLIFFLRRKIIFPIKMIFSKEEYITFTCNICGNKSNAFLCDIKGRETPSCNYCGSTLRFRSIVDAISLCIFGKSLVLPDFPISKDIISVGMSDSDNYSELLGVKLDYTNTFYHKEPKLDITDIKSGSENKYDLVISSDVFEHVPPPVQVAFNNLYKILKNNGCCVFSVPYEIDGITKEHFKDLFKYKIVKNDNYVLENETKDGCKQTFSNLCFHGGPGSVLEMRFFSIKCLIENFKNAGFSEIRIHDNNPNLGIIWEQKRSLIISVRKTI